MATRRRAPARQANERPAAFAEPLRRQGGRAGAAGLARRDARARGDQRAGRRAALVRVAAVLDRHRRSGAGRAAAARCRSARRRSRRSCCSSSSSGQRSTTLRPRRCSKRRGLDFCRHHLRSARRYRPHLLSEPEEKILAEKTISSQSAWSRLFGELASALRVELDGEELTLDVALSRLQDPDRETRRAAAEAVTAALEPGPPDARVHLQHAGPRQGGRGPAAPYPHWLASRNLANEASDESVMALIEAVRGRYDIPQRWYRLKAKLLGVDRLADYDRAAPVLRRGRHASRSARRASSCSKRTSRSRRRRGASLAGSSTSTGSTRRSARTSAAARSAPTPSRACTRTCCSTSPPGAATC